MCVLGRWQREGCRNHPKTQKPLCQLEFNI